MMRSFDYWINNMWKPSTLPGALFYGLIVLVGAWATGRFVHMIIHRYLDRAQADGSDATGIRFLGQFGKLLVYIAALLVYTHLIPALQKLGTAWLASVGVVSVVVGMAAQSTLSNLVAGISLVLYRPFRIGDRVQVSAPTGPEIGTVESIDLGYTTLETADGRRLVIPNSTIAGQASINLTRSHAQTAPLSVAFTIASGADIDQARKILLDVAKAVPKIATVAGCFVTGISSGGTVLTLSATPAAGADATQQKSDIMENAKSRFDTVGIKLA
ncbi:MAG TPA: mechanosensitive ion channel family protein [Verrucomicrobiae bacterium]|jgi:small-conductance mechanosensitive channel|nr:mechanosensitive ion channel family protein [Verrucomicrobiae bacterium]